MALAPARRAAVCAAGLAFLAALIAVPAGAAAPAGPPPGVRLVDGFESAADWSAVPADGVEMKLSREPGLHGSALRIDFRFVKGGGYAVVHRAVSLDLPENYAFRFLVRGHAPPENLEFKLVDSTGSNVWWCNRRDYVFQPEWQSVTTRKRQIPFAWGPAGGGEIRHVAAIEFAITAGGGGEGTVWLDDLELAERLPENLPPPPIVARASSSRAGHEAGRAVDGSAATSWIGAAKDAHPRIELDLGGPREFGGLRLDMPEGHRPWNVAIELADKGGVWRHARTLIGMRRAREYVQLPESEAQRVRLRWIKPPGSAAAAIRECAVLPPSFGDSPESLFTAIAGDAPRGRYPRGYVGEPRYWTVVGSEGDPEKVLFGEDGSIETGPQSFSVEPFLQSGGRLFTWADGDWSQTLAPGPLPIPTAIWNVDSLELRVTAAAIDEPGRPRVLVRYDVSSRAARARSITLDLALRPFQVNPPTQSLNHPGGVAPLHFLSYSRGVVRGEGERMVRSLTTPARFGAATFDQGDVTDFLSYGELPPAPAVYDSAGFATGALAYSMSLAPNQPRTVEIEIPLHRHPPAGDAGTLSAAAARWRSRIPLDVIQVPDSAVSASAIAQLGWILVDRSGAALRPGARAYARTWIRDGALISAALLRLGRADVVRDFIGWFAGYTYASGKVPCCVDERGSDPVPEHDSHGEFIYLVAEYVRFTGDTTLARAVWPRVAGAAAYLDTLRAQRRTAEWRTRANAPYFGLLPPSISHEGYSAKPMHAYWDDLFALRGYRDAAELAARLGDRAAAAHWRKSADEFARDLGASLRATMKAHHIDYIPGCADLGDFDATSTTIALDPVQAEGVLPRDALERTFEGYWKFFRDRRDGRESWDAYTPYELRTIGAFVRLGWRERADSLLTFFLDGQRPRGWKQWPEVVWHDARTPRFLGDLPHTWVGSDGLRSILSMLEYERESDQSLVLAAGVPERWARDSAGVGVRAIRTRWGSLTYHLGSEGGGYVVRIEPGLAPPPGGVRIAAPGVGRNWRAAVNGRSAAISSAGEVVVSTTPAVITLLPPR